MHVDTRMNESVGRAPTALLAAGATLANVSRSTFRTLMMRKVQSSDVSAGDSGRHQKVQSADVCTRHASEEKRTSAPTGSAGTEEQGFLGSEPRR